MSDSPGVLGALLGVLAPPLDYLAADDFRAAARTALPLDAIRERLGEARAAVTESRLGAQLDVLAAALAELAETPAERQAPVLRRAHAAMVALRGAAAPTGAPEEYRHTEGDPVMSGVRLAVNLVLEHIAGVHVLRALLLKAGKARGNRRVAADAVVSTTSAMTTYRILLRGADSPDRQVRRAMAGQIALAAIGAFHRRCGAR